MSKRNEAVALRWTMMMMARAFRDLATSFATVDSGRADRSIHEIEATIAVELAAFCDKPPEGITVDRVALGAVVGPLREMTQGARALVQQAGKPKQ